MSSDDLQRKLDLSESIRKDLIRKLRDIQCKYQLNAPTFQEESRHQKEVRSLKQWVTDLNDYNDALQKEVDRLNKKLLPFRIPIRAVKFLRQNLFAWLAYLKAKYQGIVSAKLRLKEYSVAGVVGSFLKTEPNDTSIDALLGRFIEQEVPPIDSLPVQLFVLSRSCDIDIESLQFFAKSMTECEHLLCPELTTQTMALLELCSEGTIGVTGFAGEAGTNVFVCPNFKIYSLEFEQWLMEATDEQQIPFAFDAVLLDSQHAEHLLNTLRGRLRPKTKLFVVGSEPNIGLNFGSPDVQLQNLHFYQNLPEDWQAPFAEPSQHQWPWLSHATSHLAALPSGRPWPKISVVTVTYNQAAFLEQTIRSVLLQGYPNLEYIVIDGGSTDNTMTILKRYSQELSFWVSEKDKGQSEALNKGFQHATGEILTWLNSDDRHLPGTLTRVAMAFDQYKPDMVAGGCLLIDDGAPHAFYNHHTSLAVCKKMPLPLDELLDLDGHWKKGQFFYQPEVFWTRQLWDRSGSCVDEALYYSMDYELWLRMAQQNAQIVHILDPLVLFRMHDQQKTHGGLPVFNEELQQVRDRFLQKMQAP
jgi:Glycosyl transferase family 2